MASSDISRACSLRDKKYIKHSYIKMQRILKCLSQSVDNFLSFAITNLRKLNFSYLQQTSRYVLQLL